MHVGLHEFEFVSEYDMSFSTWVFCQFMKSKSGRVTSKYNLKLVCFFDYNVIVE